MNVQNLTNSAGVGYPYPLPWYLYPANIFLYLFAGIYLALSPGSLGAKDKARNSAGYVAEAFAKANLSAGELLILSDEPVRP